MNVLYNEIKGILEASLRSEFQILADDKAGKIEEAVRELNKKILKRLRTLIVNKGQPNLGDIAIPEWKKLSKEYLKQKQKLKYPGFYRFKGTLSGLLGREDPEKYFGTPRVYQSIGLAGKPQFVNISATGRTFSKDNLVSRAKAGDPIYSAFVSKNGVLKKVGGQSATNLGVYTKATLTIDVMPNFKGVVEDAVKNTFLKEGSPEGIAIGERLMNTDGKQQRPILGWYMEWWIKHQIKPIVDRELRKP